MKVYEVRHDIWTLEEGITMYPLHLFSSEENAIKTAQGYVRVMMGMRGYYEGDIRNEVKALEEGTQAVFEDSDGTEHAFYVAEREIHEEVIQ